MITDMLKPYRNPWDPEVLFWPSLFFQGLVYPIKALLNPSTTLLKPYQNLVKPYQNLINAFDQVVFGRPGVPY